MPRQGWAHRSHRDKSGQGQREEDGWNKRNPIPKARTPQSTCPRSLPVQAVAEGRTEVRPVGMDPGERSRGRTSVGGRQGTEEAQHSCARPRDSHQLGLARCGHSLSSHSCLQGPVTREAVEMCQELPVRSGIHAEGEYPARTVGNGRDGEHRRPWALCRPSGPEAWLTRVAGPKPPEADLVPVPLEHPSS